MPRLSTLILFISLDIICLRVISVDHTNQREKLKGNEKDNLGQKAEYKSFKEINTYAKNIDNSLEKQSKQDFIVIPITDGVTSQPKRIKETGELVPEEISPGTSPDLKSFLKQFLGNPIFYVPKSKLDNNFVEKEGLGRVNDNKGNSGLSSLRRSRHGMEHIRRKFTMEMVQEKDGRARVNLDYDYEITGQEKQSTSEILARPSRYRRETSVPTTVEPVRTEYSNITFVALLTAFVCIVGISVSVKIGVYLCKRYNKCIICHSNEQTPLIKLEAYRPRPEDNLPRLIVTSSEGYSRYIKRNNIHHSGNIYSSNSTLSWNSPLPFLLQPTGRITRRSYSDSNINAKSRSPPIPRVANTKWSGKKIPMIGRKTSRSLSESDCDFSRKKTAFLSIPSDLKTLKKRRFGLKSSLASPRSEHRFRMFRPRPLQSFRRPDESLTDSGWSSSTSDSFKKRPFHVVGKFGAPTSRVRRSTSSLSSAYSRAFSDTDTDVTMPGYVI